ncbi:delta-60 repeat domain-containing protein [Dokdonella sp.]|uniref:delta-60 repeat domain-containing protein n=1 Tax=Dokdonella sp. TaxID=2291710 RepID=UPI001B0B97F1|nr:delta-60 repeat domain-containing protein [Dokdonella sp.]MBO9661999.1 delta-60 repeat domain-containing protein [Dokdonella sp.]
MWLGSAAALAQSLVDPSFVPSTNDVAYASTLAVQADGKVVIPVISSSLGTASLRRLGTDGSFDATFAPVDLDREPQGLLVQPDGKILVFGAGLSTVGGRAVQGIARVNPDGSVDGGFTTPTIQGQGVRRAALQPDGKILIGGKFFKVGTVEVHHLARLNADGSFDPGFVTTSLPAGTSSDGVFGLSLRADGKIVIGGWFMASGTSELSTLLRLNADGSVDKNLTAISGLAQVGGATLALPDGRLLASGSNAFSENALVRLNADDSLDTMFNPTFGEKIGGFFVQPNGKIVVSGLFSTVNGQPHNYIVRLNGDGSTDNGFDPQGNSIDTYYVTSLAAQADGRILIAGTFQYVGATPRPGLARLLVSEPATARLQFGASRSEVQWQRGGSGMELARASFESSVDGVAWQGLGEAAWNQGTWTLGGVILPSSGSLWLRARGSASTGGAMDKGFSGSIIESTRQMVATVTPFAGAGGSISPSAPQFVDTELPASFTLTPSAGQQVLGVSGTCGGSLSGNTYTTLPLNADCTVVASFTSADNFVVTPTLVSGRGSVSPQTPQGIAPGGRASFTLTPDTGSAIDSVGGTCGGSLDGAVYTTDAVSANCTVDIRFSVVTVTATVAVSGGHGSISPTARTVDYGSTATFSVMSDSGYNANVSGCGGTLSGGLYTTAPLTADCTVSASFSSFMAVGDLEVWVSKVADEGTMPDPCFTQQNTQLTVAKGERVEYCGRFTNHSDRAVSRWVVYRDALNGVVNPMSLAVGGGGFSYPIQPGESMLFVGDSDSVLETTDLAVTYTALGIGSFTDLPRYAVDDGAPFEAMNLSASHNAVDLGLMRQGTTRSVELPFSFNFYGMPVDRLCIGNDGVVQPALRTCSEPPDLITPMLIMPALRISNFGYMTGDFGRYGSYAGGNVYYEIQGKAPRRRVAIEWRNKEVAGTSGAGVTFQTLIDEASSAITFQYVSMGTDDPAAADGNGTLAGLHLTQGFSQIYPSGPLLTNGKAIRWTPTTQPFSAVAKASARITVVAPDVAVDPPAVAATSPLGGNATIELNIANRGNAALDWRLAAGGDGRGFRIAQSHSGALTSPAALSGGAGRVGSAVPTRRPALEGRPASASSLSAIAPETRTNIADLQVPAYGHATDGVNSDTSSPVVLDAAAPSVVSPTALGSHGFITAPIYTFAFADDRFDRLYELTLGACGSDAGCVGPYLRLDGIAAATDPNSSDNAFVLAGAQIVPWAGFDARYQQWRGMKWDTATRTLYAVASDWFPFGLTPPAPPYRSDLYAISALTGVATHVARIDDISSDGTVIADIAIDNHGNLYGLDMLTDSLVAIDKTSGHVRTIGSTGLNVYLWDIQSMDFDGTTGALYYATWTQDSTVGAQMFVLDTKTGSANLLGVIGDGHNGVRGLSIAKPRGPCVDADAVPWLSLDRTEGSVAAENSAAVAIRFNAIGLAQGVYRANLCVDNNTPYKRQIVVPVTFTVASGDSIFRDGFEAN